MYQLALRPSGIVTLDQVGTERDDCLELFTGLYALGKCLDAVVM